MKRSILALMLLFCVTSSFGQYSFPFFQNEYKDKYEKEVKQTTLLTQQTARLSLNIKMLSDSLRIMHLTNSQLRARIDQLESNRKKLDERISNYIRENKRYQLQVASLKQDTARLQVELTSLSEQLRQVEWEGVQRSAYLEKQIFVLKDSLSINSKLYKQTTNELTKIQSIFSYMKLGDMEFNIPSEQFISTMHSAILTGNTRIILRTSYNGEAILLFNTDVRKRKLIGYKNLPYHLEAYLHYFPHPLHVDDKTIASIKTYTYIVKHGSRAEGTDYNDVELVKSRFFKELERVNYSYDNSNTPNTAVKASLRHDY